nr:cold-regulated 47 [Tanacetum cinerariifolium]
MKVGTFLEILAISDESPFRSTIGGKGVGLSQRKSSVSVSKFKKQSHVVRDPFPITADFNAEDYATLVAHPSPFWKFTEPFLRFVRLSRHYTLDEDNYPWFVDRNGEDMDLFAFIHIPDPTKVRVVERNELRKKRQAATKAWGSSHPPKKLKSEYGAPNVAADAGKSPSDLGDLLAKSMLIVESGVEVAATLPFVTSSVSAKPECDIGVPTALERFLISSDSSHHSSNAYEPEVASVSSTAVPEPGTKVVTPVHASMFQDSNPIGTMRPNVAGPSHALEKELSVGSREVNSENLQEVYVSRWNYEELFIKFSVGTAQQACLSAKVRMQTEFCLSERGRFESELEKQIDLLKTKDKEVEDLKAQLFLKEAEAAEAIRLHAEASNFEAMERSLWDELSILNERNAILEKERNALDGKATDLEASVTGKEREITTLNAQLTAIKSQNNNFVDQVRSFALSLFFFFYIFLSACFRLVSDGSALEEKFYPRLFTTISGCRWLLTHGMELAVTKCLHSFEYLSAFGAAIRKAIEKGMQDGLAVGITHCAEGRTLADVAGYNPSTEANIDTLMNILRLEDTLAERLGCIGSQPHVDPLMFPVHHHPDKVVVGATSLSFSLDVSNARVWKIKENIMSEGSAPRDVFIPLFEPFSSEVLTGTGGTSKTVPAIVTTTLSTTLAFASIIAPITVDDYGVVGMDGQASVDGM